MCKSIVSTAWIVPLCACLLAFSAPASAEDIGTTQYYGLTVQEDVGTGLYGYATQEDVSTGLQGYSTQEDVGIGSVGRQTREGVGTGSPGSHSEAHGRAREAGVFQRWLEDLYRGYF